MKSYNENDNNKTKICANCNLELPCQRNFYTISKKKKKKNRNHNHQINEHQNRLSSSSSSSFPSDMIIVKDKTKLSTHICVECSKLMHYQYLFFPYFIKTPFLYTRATKVYNYQNPTHTHRVCQLCRWLMPVTTNFEINNCASTTGKVFRKWTCMHCRKKSAQQLRAIKKNLNMKEYYGKKCPICLLEMSSKGSVRAIPDHCHMTGKLRGIICNNCNTAIGKLNDDPDMLQRALLYLKQQ